MGKPLNSKVLLMRLGVNVHEDDVIKEAIYRENGNILRVVTIVALIAMLLLIVAAQFVPVLVRYASGYIAVVVLLAILCIVSWTKLKKTPNLSLPVAYFFSACLYLFAIYVSVSDPETVSVVFVALVVIIPTIFADRPWRMFLFNAFATAVFCASSVMVKPFEVYSTDLVHSIVFAAVGISVGIYLTNTKANAALLDHHIEYMGNMDALTGLLNRHSFDEDTVSFRYLGGGDDTVVMSIDVNGLKESNDTYGHAAGDELLKGVSECMVETLGTEGKIYRVGGDEFVAIIHGDKFRVQVLVDELRKRCARWYGEKINGINVAVGWVFVEEYPELSLEELLTIADKRMYEDKKQFYTEESRDRRRN